MPAPLRQSGLSHTRWRLFHHYWWPWTKRSRASLCWQVIGTLDLEKLGAWMKTKSDFVTSRYFLNGDFDSELPSLNTVRLDHACSSYYDHNDQLVSLFFHRPRFLYNFELQWHSPFCNQVLLVTSGTDDLGNWQYRYLDTTELLLPGKASFFVCL